MKIFDINHKTEILFEKKLDFSLYCSFLGLKRLKLPYFATKIKFSSLNRKNIEFPPIIYLPMDFYVFLLNSGPGTSSAEPELP